MADELVHMDDVDFPTKIGGLAIIADTKWYFLLPIYKVRLEYIHVFKIQGVTSGPLYLFNT